MDLSFLPSVPLEHSAREAWLNDATGLIRDQFRSVRKLSRTLAWARFATFAMLVAGAYYYLSKDAAWGPLLAGAGLALFCLSVSIHRRVRDRATTLQYLQDIVAESARRIAGDPVVIRSGQAPDALDTWRELFDEDDGEGAYHALSTQESGDLDLFGEPLSLYGVLNRSSSCIGECRLAHRLMRPSLAPEEILRRQAATRWMKENPVSRMRFMASVAGMRKMADECRKLYLTLSHAKPMPRRGLIGVLRVWGLAAPVALAMAIANLSGWQEVDVGFVPLVIVVMINAVLIQFFLKPIRERVRPWFHLDEVVPRLKFIAETARDVLPSDGLLGEQRRRFVSALGPDCLPALSRRIPLLFLSLSGIMHTIIEVLVFWDIQVLWMLEKCYIRHRTQLVDSINALGECEYYACLGSFAWEQPVITCPEFSKEKWHLEIQRGRHPLIHPAESVPNSLTLGGDVRTWVITGSNMSGKSTFLRMAAVNVLLAQIGCAATCDRILLAPLEILSDLRIRDELSKKESYFLAEVRQVRRMVLAARQDHPIFALIDEPFRGTNSAERVAAASAVVTELINGSGIHLVATHDAALTSLGDADYARNFHFQEAFEQNELAFDYSLRTGPAHSRNALRVLESEGYPVELVQRARAMLPRIREDSSEP